MIHKNSIENVYKMHGTCMKRCSWCGFTASSLRRPDRWKLQSPWAHLRIRWGKGDKERDEETDKEKGETDKETKRWGNRWFQMETGNDFKERSDGKSQDEWISMSDESFCQVLHVFLFVLTTVLTVSFSVSVKLILSRLVFDGCVKWISFRFFVQGYLCQVVATAGMVHCVTNVSGFLAIFEFDWKKSKVLWDDLFIPFS